MNKTQKKKHEKHDYLLPSYIEATDSTQKLNKRQREVLRLIDEGMHEHWRLGRNIMLCWCPSGRGIDVLIIPFYHAASFFMPAADRRAHNSKAASLLRLIKDSRRINEDKLAGLETVAEVEKVHIKLPGIINDKFIDPKFIDEIIKRYSITHTEDRAVALFDIVGFSKYSPFEQMTLLNSLSYSINSAHSKMMDHNISVEFARTTTGDGYYIWNRDNSIQGNINLYHVMHLVLADNAIARTKSHSNTAPIMKTAFHIGNFYEYFQSEALRPTKYNYIVGDVTIELARMIENAIPGQILVGQFQSHLLDFVSGNNKVLPVDAIQFIDLLQDTLSSLRGLELSGEGIDAISCYLTGEKQGDSFSISRYELTDKHNLRHHVYNAKVNIYREKAPPIYLGVQEKLVRKENIVRLKITNEDID